MDDSTLDLGNLTAVIVQARQLQFDRKFRLAPAQGITSLPDLRAYEVFILHAGAFTRLQ